MYLRRWNIFWSIDRQSYAYRGTDEGIKQRLKEELQHAREYIYSKAPQKYHDILVPDFELGCKRKIADPDLTATEKMPPQGYTPITYLRRVD